MPINPDRLRTGGAFAGPLAQSALPPEPPQRELAVGERVGAFEIERELSRGGMGIVYLAHRADGEFAQRVALKWMSGARDRAAAEVLFRRERDILASLDHPGIARLIDGGRTVDNMLWFAMEYVEGEAIDRWCAARALDHRARVRLVLELIDALDFAHQRLLIHRDIKPANVLVGADGRARLLDFGIARLADQHDLLGSAALTPGYASPEQWAHEEVTVVSDVYQTALLLAAVLEVLPRPRASMHVTRTVASAQPSVEPAALQVDQLRALPRDLAAIILKATALRPAARYASVSALGEDLRRWLTRRPVLARSGGLGYRCACAVRRHPWASIAAALATLALAVLGWRLAVERQHAREEAARANAEAARTRGALDYLTGLLQWADPRNHGGNRISVDEALDRGNAQLADSMRDQPLLRAELQQMLGGIYLMREDIVRAEPLLRAARAEFARRDEISLAQRARNAIDLSIASVGQDSEEAMALLREAIDGLSQSPEHAEMRIEARRHLASQVYRVGDVLEAREQMQQALVEAMQNLPANAAELIPIRNNLAGFIGDLGDHQAALALKRINLDAAHKAYGDAHPSTSLARTTLARTLLALNRLDEAAALIDMDGQTRERLWGKQHAQYGVYLQNLARVQLRRGLLEQARASIVQAISISRGAGEVGMLQLSSQLANLAEIDLRLRRPEAAEQALREALGPELQRTAVVKDLGARRLLLVSALRAQGQYDDASREIDAAAQEMAPLPQDHPRRGAWLVERAALDAHAGQLDAARATLQRAQQLLDAASPSVERDDALALLAHERARLAAQR
jgi:serine/threonine-protein kinase